MEKLLYKKILLLIFVMVLFFIVAEIICRISQFAGNQPETIPDEHLYYIHKPNTTWTYTTPEYSVTNIINSDGFVGRNYPSEKGNNTYRIAILGDSNVEALRVNQNVSWARLLEDKLNSESSKKIEIIKFARGGVGTLEEKLFYEYRAKKYNPDMVILVFHNNDPGDNLVSAVTMKNLGVMQILRQSYLLKFLRYKVLGVIYEANNIPDGMHYFSTGFDNKTEYARQYAEDLILDLKTEVEGNNSKFLMVYFPAYYETNTTFFNEEINDYQDANNYVWDTKLIENRLSDFSNKNNVEFFSMTDGVIEVQKSSGKRLYGVFDPHMDESGNQAVADILYQYIKNKVPDIIQAHI